MPHKLLAPVAEPVPQNLTAFALYRRSKANMPYFEWVARHLPPGFRWPQTPGQCPVPC